MNYKYLFYFETSKFIIAIINIFFIVENHPTSSIIISLLSLATSLVGIAIIFDLYGAITFAIISAILITIGLFASGNPAIGNVIALGTGAVVAGVIIIYIFNSNSTKEESEYEVKTIKK